MADPITVIFRNQCRAPVLVTINGYGSGGDANLVYSGVVSGQSGLFQVSGYTSYACSAATIGNFAYGPTMTHDSAVSIVFKKVDGIQK